MNPQDNVQKAAMTDPQNTIPNNPPHDPIQQGLGSNVAPTQFPQTPMGYVPPQGVPQHGVQFGMHHPGMMQGQFGPLPGPQNPSGVHYVYPVQPNYTQMPGGVGAVPPQGGYPQNVYVPAPYQQSPVPPSVSGAVPAQGSFPQNLPPQQGPMAAAPPQVYYGAPQHHYPQAYPAHYPPPGHYSPYPPQQFTQTMGSVETGVYSAPGTTQSAESVNKAPSEDVEVEHNTIQGEQAFRQQVPNPSFTPQVIQSADPVMSPSLANPCTSEDAPIVEKKEVVQEMNNLTLEDSPSFPVSSNTMQETEKSVNQANPDENSLLDAFMSDLKKRLEKLSKEDQTEVIQNALSRLGLHECIDALVEEFGIKALTEAATGPNF